MAGRKQVMDMHSETNGVSQFESDEHSKEIGMIINGSRKAKTV